MNKKKITRMTLDDIVKAKLQKDTDKLTVKEIEIPSIGKTLMFRRPTRAEICEFMDGITQTDQQTEEMLEVFQGLIYSCCDDLHSQELCDQLGIDNPEEIVPAIMDDADILTVGDEVAGLNPLYKHYAAEEKNS